MFQPVLGWRVPLITRAIKKRHRSQRASYFNAIVGVSFGQDFDFFVVLEAEEECVIGAVVEHRSADGQRRWKISHIVIRT